MEARPWKKSAKGVESIPSSSSSSSFIADLPNPILMEILCRVSIKTLTTSKSVCKSWLSLIKDPHFCQIHQSRSPTEVCFQPYHDSKGNTLELHLGNFHFPSNLDPCHFEIPKFSVRSGNVLNYNVVKRKFYFANSCNGLLCYYGDPNYRFAVVWNPCTSEFITFPTSRPCRGYGLGFSRKENKFKLLRLMGGSGPSDTVVADICTIEKACSWKMIGPCSSHAWFRDYWDGRDLHAVFLEGTLHWVGTDSQRSHIVIHTFDFEDDHFGTLPLPPWLAETDRYMLREDKLGVLGGCLFVTNYTDEGATIWSMREYGVQSSWKKLFCLVPTFDDMLRYDYCRPATYMDNGEILMICTYRTSNVFVYNPVLKTGRVIGLCPDSLLRVIAYNPSLVLLRDSMLGYDVHVKPKCAGLKQGEMSTTPNWWRPIQNRWIPTKYMKKLVQQYGSKEPLTNDELSGTEVEEEREGHISGKGLIQISTTSAADLSCQQDPKTPATTDETQDNLKQITTMVLEQCEQRQELEERLRNELALNEHLKLQNQQFEERLKDEHAKVEYLKQQNQQFEERLQDEHAKVEQLEDQIEKLSNKQEHKQKIKQMKDQWIAVKKSAQEHGSKAPITNDDLSGTEVEEEREGHVSGKGLIQISTTAAADFACQQGAKTPATSDEIHVSATREDRLERITTMMGEVLEELRKERVHRQELEEKLRNELEPLKEQIEHLKLQNQQFEERLQDDHAKVKHLKQQNQQFEERLQDEHVNIVRLKQQNQQFEGMLQDEHAKVKQLEDKIE